MDDETQINSPKDNEGEANQNIELQSSAYSLNDDDPFLSIIDDALGPLDEFDLSLDSLLISSRDRTP
jgi:hypothetical protein